MKNLLSASGIPPCRREECWLIEARGLSGLGMNSSFQSLSSRREKTLPKGVDSKTSPLKQKISWSSPLISVTLTSLTGFR